MPGKDMRVADHKVALVTGANRGLGLEISRQLASLGVEVAMAGRDRERLALAADEVVSTAGKAFPVSLDVCDRLRIRAAVDEIIAGRGRIDILVNNAGVLLDGGDSTSSVPVDIVEATLETNVIGPMLLTQSVLPIMRRNGYGRVVNMSSALGAHHDVAAQDSPHDSVDSPAYRLSKAALNMLTALFARETRAENILVNSACPGWVRTGMGTDRAPLSVEEGADTPVWLATLPDGGPSGGFFKERRRLDW